VVVAAALGAKRAGGSKKKQAVADIESFRAPCGMLLSVEVKARPSAPKIIENGLAQATRYEPAAAPVLVVKPHGRRPIASLFLDDLLVILGIKQLGQLALSLCDEPAVAL
jgi:hypothetical protein